MLPNIDTELDDITTEQDEELQPSRTYKIDFENKRIVGMIDDYEAVVQFIRKSLNTDKYAFEIYNWCYGNEIRSLIGMPYSYVVTRLPNIIKEAVLTDERILDVRDCTFEQLDIDSMLISCNIDTVYGTVNFEQEVSI